MCLLDKCNANMLLYKTYLLTQININVLYIYIFKMNMTLKIYIHFIKMYIYNVYKTYILYTLVLYLYRQMYF